jgi:diguanylate cyclase (GGDEF)-like protein
MPTDALTGFGDLEALRARFVAGAPAAVAIWIDIDGLIWFNDSEGHEAGDAAIAKIAAMVRAESGLEGFRVGGDEFVLVGPALTSEAANAIADRIVARAPTLDLRFSVKYRANNRDVLTVSALVFHADHRLALEREKVRDELAQAIYDAGLATNTKYARRG